MFRWVLRFTLAVILFLFLYATHSSTEMARTDNNIGIDFVMSEPMINFRAVRLLYCGTYNGTGIIIDKDTILTAAHVVDKSIMCLDAGSGYVGMVKAVDYDLDIAILSFKPDTLPKKYMKLSCDGFEKGKIYYAIGWENGEEPVMNRMISTGLKRPANVANKRFLNLAILEGRIIVGMSGGPIVNEKGYVIGMNNLTNDVDLIGFSREMRDTPFCSN